MYSERIIELNTATEQYREQINQFLALADFLYNDLGLLGEVHSHIDGENVTYTLELIDRPATSVQIRKKFTNSGETDWSAIDLTNPTGE